MIRKIALIIPSLKVGGMERVMSELANYFATRSELEIHLILYGKSRKIFYAISENITIHKPSFIFRDKNRFFSTLKTFIFIRKTIIRINPVSILSFGEYWNSLVLLALKGLNFPVYISDRCQPDREYSKIHTLLRKYLYPASSGIVAQTNYARDIFLREFKHSNIRVIFNPIRDNFLPGIKKEKLILTVGRLIETKHHDRLINIFSKLSAPEWKLVIIGGNDLKQNNLKRLKEQVKSLNLDDKVILAGEISNIEDYYNMSMIFAFTSSSEGFPNVIGEALSVGIPVVSYDCIAGPADLITDCSNGFLVPLFDDDQFRFRLQTLIDSEHLRIDMGTKAKESIKLVGCKTIGEQYLEFILQ